MAAAQPLGAGHAVPRGPRSAGSAPWCTGPGHHRSACGPGGGAGRLRGYHFTLSDTKAERPAPGEYMGWALPAGQKKLSHHT